MSHLQYRINYENYLLIKKSCYVNLSSRSDRFTSVNSTIESIFEHCSPSTKRSYRQSVIDQRISFVKERKKTKTVVCRTWKMR